MIVNHDIFIGQHNAEHEMNIFKHAEWRWPLADVCDDKWHHYAISVIFPEVQVALFITNMSPCCSIHY